MTREQLQQELEESKKKLEQYQHRMRRIECKIAYLQDKGRRERAHRLITRGAAVESIWPEVKGFSETDFYGLMENILSLPQAKSVLHSFLPKGGIDS